jgi:hypothetical protein
MFAITFLVKYMKHHIILKLGYLPRRGLAAGYVPLNLTYLCRWNSIDEVKEPLN